MHSLISKIVPWGRSFEEYVSMFGLRKADLDRRIVACADGPAAFNAVMHRLGKRVISVDPLYAHSGDSIRERIHEAKDLVVEDTRLHEDRYVWESIPSIDALVATRISSMECFLQDYDGGLASGRYLAYSLPDLPFLDDEFELALCSHFLFTYSEQCSLDFHARAIREMLRVAREARVFPLLDMNGKVSPHLGLVLDYLADEGVTSEIVRVPYEFQYGGNEMLRVRR